MRLPVPATVVLGNDNTVKVMPPQRLRVDAAGVLYLVEAGRVKTAWGPTAWMAVKAGV